MRAYARAEGGVRGGGGHQQLPPIVSRDGVVVVVQPLQEVCNVLVPPHPPREPLRKASFNYVLIA